jgi:CubicO group peptidase (beta-lactamase class C family)
VNLINILLVVSLLFQIPAGAQPSFSAVYDFDETLETAHNLPRIKSLLVNQNNELILERYFNGTGPNDQSNIKSVSKSVISALVGIAIQHGHINSIDQAIIEYFGEEDWTNDNALKKEITVENLLTMQSGLETTSNRNYGKWIASTNWVTFALQQPLQSAPGRLMEYSTGNTHLLSAILTKATGLNTLEFARKMLTEPLGFRLMSWPQDPQGIYFGGNDMEMTPNQMLLFGELYLNRGEANGRQIIPSEWIDDTLEHRAQSRRDRSRYYGYGWWMKEMAGHNAHYAWGFGGQFIVIVPTLDLVVVTTSSSNPGSERQAHTRSIYDLLEYGVISSVSTALGYSASGQSQ